ncbi:hypothetical protein Vadar_002425 [Vaccinium darrowii]|uniref:Uncharacterized protein n=1 Tax=Vaccinium darrowii TaxID=229202 RepID=A0ACB7ZH27_9ERIC|nr:hypothetical protein Vadar_002425 [Vaccinium darrowii]
MERKTRMVVFGVVSAVVLQCAAAQTMYVVGDSLGWTIPQNGEEASVSWASNKTFMVGDVLSKCPVVILSFASHILVYDQQLCADFLHKSM